MNAWATRVGVDVGFRNGGVRLRCRVRPRCGARAAAVVRKRTVLPVRVAEESEEKGLNAVAVTHGSNDEASEDAEFEDVETVRLRGRVLLGESNIDASEAWRLMQPLLCPRDANESRECVDKMSTIVSCEARVDSERRVRLRQTSRWRHNALIRGKSTTVVDVEKNEGDFSIGFNVVPDACRHSSAGMTPTLRSYVGQTKLQRVGDRLALTMSGTAKIDRARSVATKLVRDVMVGAMRHQMESSLKDLSRHISGQNRDGRS
jgi:hypothetical protein